MIDNIVLGGSIKGPSTNPDKVNQDSFFSVSEGGITVIAVADGAGSLKNSHIGAQLAAQISSEETLDSLLDGNSPIEAIQNGIEKARETLVGRDDKKEIGCTLAVAIITDHGWATGVVGDAFTVVSYDDDTHELVRPERISEFANVTELLTSKGFNPVYLSGDDSLLAITVSSDGLESSSLSDGKPLQGFWTPMIDRVGEGKLNIDEFLSYLESKEKIVDDTTLMIAAF